MIPKVKKSLPKRVNRIEAAKKLAKKLDVVCLVSGLNADQLKDRGSFLTASHLLPTNYSGPRYSPDNPDFIFALRIESHTLNEDCYERLGIEGRKKWLAVLGMIRPRARVWFDMLCWLTDMSIPEEDKPVLSWRL